MKQFNNDKYFRFVFSVDKKYGFSVFFRINSETIVVTLVIIIIIIIIIITIILPVRSKK